MKWLIPWREGYVDKIHKSLYHLITAIHFKVTDRIGFFSLMISCNLFSINLLCQFVMCCLLSWIYLQTKSPVHGGIILILDIIERVLKNVLSLALFTQKRQFVSSFFYRKSIIDLLFISFVENCTNN